MVEHVTEWLGPYLDGELHSLRLRQVETHLEKCAACRLELKSLRNLSMLLQEPVPAGTFMPTGRFVSQLTLQLPRRLTKTQRSQGPSLAWWLAPAALLGLWFFLLTVINLNGVISLITRSGLLENLTAWFPAGAQHSGLYLTVMDVFGSQMGAVIQSTLSIADRVSQFGENIFSQLLWQAGIALLYWTWMVIWWLRARRQPVIGTLVRP